MFKDVPVAHSMSNTPISPSGAATIIISGSIHEANWAAITR